MQSPVPQHPSAVPLQLQCLALALSKPQAWAKLRSLRNHPDAKVHKGELFLQLNRGCSVLA